MNMKFRIFHTVFIALCSVFLVSSPKFATARVILKEKITFYDVTGRTGREIFKSMVDNGPKLGGRRGHALATTEYEYDVKNLDVKIENGRCIPSRLDILVQVKYTFPKWTPKGSVKSTTREAWKDFSKSVRWHEEQHG